MSISTRTMGRIMVHCAKLLAAVELGRPVHRRIPAILPDKDEQNQLRLEVRKFIQSGEQRNLGYESHY